MWLFLLDGKDFSRLEHIEVYHAVSPDDLTYNFTYGPADFPEKLGIWMMITKAGHTVTGVPACDLNPPRTSVEETFVVQQGLQKLSF